MSGRAEENTSSGNQRGLGVAKLDTGKVSEYAH